MNKKQKNKKNRKEKTLFDLPSVDSYPSRKIWEDACWQKILRSERFLEPIITSSERHNLVMRAVAMNRINSGKQYREIAEELWLSPQTISGLRKAIKEEGYKSYRERGKTERKKKVYTSDTISNKIKPNERRVRTKYGRVYLP